MAALVPAGAAWALSQAGRRGPRRRASAYRISCPRPTVRAFVGTCHRREMSNGHPCVPGDRWGSARRGSCLVRVRPPAHVRADHDSRTACVIRSACRAADHSAASARQLFSTADECFFT